jgi:hypothetical protein
MMILGSVPVAVLVAVLVANLAAIPGPVLGCAPAPGAARD